MKILSRDDLERRMKEQLAAIPTPQFDKTKKKSAQLKNRNEDRENIKHTIKILHERESEAMESGDRLKKFHAISVAKDQQDQYNVRNNLSQLQEKFDFIRSTIPEDDWIFLEPLIEFENEILIEGDFSEQDLHCYIKDEFGVHPKFITKLIQLVKIKQEIRKIELVL